MFVITNLIIYTFSIFIYKFLWNKFFLQRVPKGVGIILCIIICINFLILDYNFEFNNYFLFFLILIFSLIYWIDDLSQLPSILRLCIQFIMGAIIPIIIFDINIFTQLNIFYLSVFVFGILSIFLTNTINFYDGADLNVTIFGIINLFLLLIIFNSNPDLLLIIISALIFFFCFSFFNHKPNNIFFGDAGSFFLSTLIIFFICISILDGNYRVVYLLIGLTLPIFDVVYVIILRIYLRESLNTRHFYQIYQIAQNRFKYKFYILIQPINSGLIFLCILIMRSFGLDIYLSTLLSSFFVTISFYIFVRFILLKDKIKKYE